MNNTTPPPTFQASPPPPPAAANTVTEAAVYDQDQQSTSSSGQQQLVEVVGSGNTPRTVTKFVTGAVTSTSAGGEGNQTKINIVRQQSQVG